MQVLHPQVPPVPDHMGEENEGTVSRKRQAEIMEDATNTEKKLKTRIHEFEGDVVFSTLAPDKLLKMAKAARDLNTHPIFQFEEGGITLQSRFSVTVCENIVMPREYFSEYVFKKGLLLKVDGKKLSEVLKQFVTKHQMDKIYLYASDEGLGIAGDKLNFDGTLNDKVKIFLSAFEVDESEFTTEAPDDVEYEADIRIPSDKLHDIVNAIGTASDVMRIDYASDTGTLTFTAEHTRDTVDKTLAYEIELETRRGVKTVNDDHPGLTTISASFSISLLQKVVAHKISDKAHLSINTDKEGASMIQYVVKHSTDESKNCYVSIWLAPRIPADSDDEC